MPLEVMVDNLDELTGNETLTVKVLTSKTGNKGEVPTKELLLVDQNGNLIYQAKKI